MNCRKQLGIFVRGSNYSPPKTSLDTSRLMENVHLRAYVRHLFYMLPRVPNSPNITSDSYQSQMRDIFKYYYQSIPEKLIFQNIEADIVTNKKTGLSFENYFHNLIRYIVLFINSSEIQKLIDSIFKLLNFFKPILNQNTDISLNKPPYPLPLNFWESLIHASKEIRPCFILMGVNTQRSKLFERILSDLTGSLLLDIPNLIQWPYRTENIENARKKLLKGGYLTYNDSKDLIIECAKNPIALYRGWIIPTSFHKENFDFSTLFPNYSEFEQRCFSIDLDSNLESLLEIADTRKFDPQDEKIISTLESSSLTFVQRLKRREFVGRDIDASPEEEENQKSNEEEEDQEEKLMLYKTPKYSTPEELGDETTPLPEDDEEIRKRLITLPEESHEQITKRFNIYEKEKNSFYFPNKTKIIIVDATQSLKEMANIICDKTSIILPCIYPKPIQKNEDEEHEEPKFSPVKDNCVVSLLDEHQIIKGDPQTDIIFYGFTFRFQNIEKRNKFSSNPINYLQPFYHSYHQRIILTGVSQSGKKTISKLLSNFFDIKLIDFNIILEEAKKLNIKKSNDNNDDNNNDDNKENIKQDIPNPFPNGYLCLILDIDFESLKIISEVESIAPQSLIFLKLNPDENILSQRIRSSESKLTIQQYKIEIEKWTDKFNEFLENSKELSFPIKTVDASNPIDEVFWSCVYCIDNLLPKCGETSDEEFKPGYLGNYCPVTLKDKQLLYSGSDITTTFQNAIFSFADENCLERFKAAPLSFIRSLPIVPPPRILILGSRGTSKTSIANEIGKKHNTNVYELPRNPIFTPHNEEEEEPDQEEITKNILIPFFQEILEKSNNQKNGWIIEGTPSHSITTTLFIESGLKPDFIIYLEHDEKWALMRNRHRLNNDEQILSEESESSSLSKEIANSLGEITSKGEPFIIDTSRRFSSIMDLINRTISKELTIRDSLFVSQSSYIIEEGLNSLKNNNLFLSQFGKYCPVCLYEKGQLILTNLNISCGFLGRIFFFDSNKHRQIFMDSPLKFVFQQHPPLFPSIPKISILGNSELALKIAESLGAELIKPKDVISRVAKHQTTFGAKIRKILATGGTVNSNLFKQGLKSVLFRHDCQIHGYVLDGFPIKLIDLLEMRKNNLMPSDLIISKSNDELINYSIENFHNVYLVDNKSTLWLQLINSLNYINLNLKLRWESLIAIDEKRPYNISSLDISPQDIIENLSEFEHYCPVSYIADDLILQSKFNDWKNIVSFNGKYYHMHNNLSCEAFIKSPIPFIYSWNNKPITFSKIIKNDNNLIPEVEGYDIVYLSKNQFIKGLQQYSLIFSNKYYLFNKEETFLEFIRNSWNYINIILPPHRPVEIPNNLIPLNNLPPVSFLEQTIGEVVTECIVQLSIQKPKIPFKSIEDSINEYIATFIKANSKNIGPMLREKFIEELNQLNEYVNLAKKLKESLEIPFELRDQIQHEKLCKMWNDLRLKFNKK